MPTEVLEEAAEAEAEAVEVEAAAEDAEELVEEVRERRDLTTTPCLEVIQTDHGVGTPVDRSHII